MSYVLKVLLQDDLAVKLNQVAKKPKTGKLMVGPKGQLSPPSMNLRKSLGVNPTGMFTKSQVNKVFRTK
jgi:hypothetical protein